VFIICHRLVSTTTAVPVAKFTTGVVDIPVVHLDLYLGDFSKKFEMTLMLLSGVWGKMIHEKNVHEKNVKQKSRDTDPKSFD
jgi:hypothetical protein